MDKYEYRVKTEQMLEYMEKKQYKKAMEIADTIDWRRVKNASMLNSVSEIYEYNGEYQKSRDVLFIAYDRAPGSRKTVYRLGMLALKIHDTDEASDCYEEFVRLAPKDPNQFILKYKILKARRAPLSEQIEVLEDFKKAEYVEKWAYELAKLYHEAGMTAECLEECDDLILWFSEGKYVYQSMELKMKYKPLTPLQQEKYDSMRGLSAHAPHKDRLAKEEAPVEEQKETAPRKSAEEGTDREAEEEAASEEPSWNTVEQSASQTPGTIDAETREIRLDELRAAREQAMQADAAASEEEKETPETEEPRRRRRKEESPIRRTVKGATLAEALANGVKVASGMAIEDIEKKASPKRDEDMRITGQMKIEEILAAWEAKQKDNAEAIQAQKKRDEEKLARKKREAQRRREEEARRIEEQQRAAEEARRIAEQRAAEEARRLAEEQAEQERLLAKQRADEEKRLARQKEEEEEALLDRIASGQVTAELKEAVKNVVPREEAEEPAEEETGEEADLMAADYEEADQEEADYEEADYEEAQESEQEEAGYEEPAASAADFEEPAASAADFEEPADEPQEKEEDPVAGMTVDLRQLVEELEAEEPYEDDYEEAGFADEDDYDEEPADEADSYGEDEYEEAGFEAEADYEEADLEEAGYEEDDYEEDDYEEAGYDADDYDEDDLVDDYEDYDDYDDGFFDEDEEEDEEEEPEEEEDMPEEPARKLTRKEKRARKKAEKEAARQARETGELVIEEPTEEEIQRRIQKGKGGVPFDTGFVVTGRYDLSATSEIGLKAGLTEEQKQLFSYFVPVRGMSEQIVEVLDNDRRERRGGTSRTGNILVIGHKGSGKTVLAVDMVKAIQKQRNLKQGKVAIVTGESLNKKDIPNIIQKLRGGAIIIEKAGKLNARTIRELDILMEKKTGELLFVLEDQKKALERLFTANPDFKKKFTSRLELPVFINDELVTFGQTYAKENGYKLDEMGILALYSRIDMMQREDHAVSVAEVKEIMDAAIDHSQKANVKHLARRMFRKGTDESERIILKEDDFKS